VSVDAILEALRDLDKAADTSGTAWLRREMRRRAIDRCRSSRFGAGGNSGTSLSQ